MCGDQYGDAGLPALYRLFSQRQQARITFMWLIATAVAGLIFPSLGHDEFLLTWNLAIVAASVWLALKAAAILTVAGNDDPRSLFRSAFIRLNVYALIVVVSVSANAVQTVNG